MPNPEKNSSKETEMKRESKSETEKMTTEMVNKKNSAKETEMKRESKSETEKMTTKMANKKNSSKRKTRERKKIRDREDDYRDGEQKELIKELIKGNRERENEYDLSSVIELVRRADAHSPSYYHRDRDPSEGY